jgi:hypothetical protein
MERISYFNKNYFCLFFDDKNIESIELREKRYPVKIKTSENITKRNQCMCRFQIKATFKNVIIGARVIFI